jgi:acyl transferase domain-containing protein
MSCIFPKANNLREFWANNVNGIDAVIDKPAKRWPTQKNWSRDRSHESYLPCSKAGFLAEGVFVDPVRFGIVPNLVRHGDPDQFFMIACIDSALRDAKIGVDDPIRERTDVIVGRGGYASMKMIELGMRAELFEDFVEILDRKYPDMFEGRRQEVEKYLFSTLTPLPVDNVSTAVSNIAASRPANRFNLRGVSYVVDGACASSLLAVESGIWRLRNGQSDMVVAGGLFVSMNPSFFYIFNRLGGFSESQVIRPFDRRADGLMVGEGGGAVILKRLEDAIRDRDQIYAVIKGVGSSSDGLGLDVLARNRPSVE